MKTWAKQFALVFFTGLIALAAALGYGAMIGDLLNSHPFLVALRFFGLSYMAGGLVLWIALRRDEAGKPGLNPFLGLLSGVGGILALVGMVFPFSDVSYLLGLGGLGLAASALLIGFLAMVFAPAYPRPIEKRWEVEAPASAESHQPVDEHVSEPQDLTRIEGIGPKLQEVLYQAGISTYADLAAREPEEIGSIVKAASFRAPFDPATWPKQAELAAKGDWDALQDLQDELSGGRAAG